MRKLLVSLLGFSAATVVFLAGCSSAGPAESASKMTSYSASETKADTATLFTVPDDQMAHLQVVPVQKSNLERRLRLAGNVTYNAFKTTPVFSPIGGPVHEILVAPGETVHGGQPLLTVNSPDYSAARSAYLKARDAFFLADKVYTRSQDLYAHGAVAEADLQQAESSRSQAQADLQASADMLRALGIKDPEAMIKNPPKTTLQIPLPAPVGGEIVERLVGPGQLLQAGATQVFTISDMSTVWVLVNVYQSDVGYVRVGDSVEITTDTYPQVFHGRISYVAPALDPNTRTLQARIVTGNPNKILKKDMYVTAMLQAGVIRDALTVPDAAVLRDTENMPFVYAQSGTNQFARRLVKVGDSQAGRTQVTDGLKEGDRVVGDGSLFLQFKNSLQH
ncbi:MAG TPA: efflux RND transporter periplasmic adaptor subunit [Candidatus Acidoferrum sp.]|jgi:cobalt-zinc-cadmium efflux system membrane fusion protein|nr:efflux RND transporter periplasmic adaptor subunit [Candidatus Acidoferrum sp.]